MTRWPDSPPGFPAYATFRQTRCRSVQFGSRTFIGRHPSAFAAAGHFNSSYTLLPVLSFAATSSAAIRPAFTMMM